MEKSAAIGQFRFRKNDSIGNAEAESDDSFLLKCFVDTGDLATLRDFGSTKRILVGRTGSGKSALIRMLCRSEDNVIELRPENLALNYLANSSVMRFFEDAGTQLDVFYQLLWKHVLVVELIRRKFRITNESTEKSFFERLSGVFSRDRAKEQAINYLAEWGDNFWNETENRVREVTSKIERNLQASLTGTAAGAKLEAGGGERLSAEEKSDVVQRGARVVSQLQLAALNSVLKLLEDEVFNDPQVGYFVVIDDLDTRWVEDGLKFKLIRALIETAKSFRQVSRVKVVVALRLDLLQRVISATRDSGFQSEKYESMYLRLRWTEPQLLDVVTRRLNLLVSQRYTSRPLGIEEVFPINIHKSRFSDFLCQRTSLRPRDAILFINECLLRATERHQVTAQMVQDAEAAYSEKRTESLEEEWGGVYPQVGVYLRLLTRKPAIFPVSEFSRSVLEDWYTAASSGEDDRSDPVMAAAKNHFLDGKGSHFEVALALVDSMYTIGLIGVKVDSTTPCYWSFYSDHRIARGSIKPSSAVHLHQTFWRALGVRVV
jgi:hypothetical protein